MPSAIAPLAAPHEDRPALRRLEAELGEVRARSSQGSSTYLLVDGEKIELPPVVLEALARLVHQMAMGNAVSLVPVTEQLTTQQAAELLGVSRPYLVQLLEAGRIPFQKVGTHRRIAFEDLIHFKQKRDTTRREALRKLTEEAERLELEY